ncbi:hypothetical protein LFE01_18400 [Limosilactobacillus fermentum]|nr:hypothetical protein LFE01_18400 [Limosilactobacillus fermentum]
MPSKIRKGGVTYVYTKNPVAGGNGTGYTGSTQSTQSGNLSVTGKGQKNPSFDGSGAKF